MQQGRVTLEADWNESQTIFGEELRLENLDIIGPAGTPDNGYEIVVSGKAPMPPFDFTVGKGIMYVGGVRLVLDAPVQYSKQSDWLDFSTDPDWVMPTTANPATDEYVYLLVREQEVSAVEDNALREVALGGPDTAARTRMIQHFVRLGTKRTDCAGGLTAAEAYWAKEGLVFDPATMRLVPQSKLQVSFGTLPKPDPCEPEVTGGYLGADNQMIRVQITGPNTLVWGFDDASFLYRVNIDSTAKILTLQSQPVDAFHQPQANQAVEVLRSAALLSDGQYVASATGVVQTLTSSYNQSNQQLALPTALPSSYTDPAQTPQPYLRVWQQQLNFTPGTPVQLGSTGVYVTLTTAGGAPFHVGDYWMIAVRPSTPTQVYPARLLQGKEPDGPRMWACPLAAIEWDSGILKLDGDCRVEFCNLVEACTEGGGGGCCTVTVKPTDAANLQMLVDAAARGLKSGTVIVCLAPGQYNLTQPLVLDSQHSGLSIEACGEGATIQVASGSEQNFLHGMIVLNAVNGITLRGLNFMPPLVPFGSAGGLLAGLSADLLKSAGIDLNDWLVSIGVRMLMSRDTTIEDCSFLLSTAIESEKANVFAAAIFGSGQNYGTTTIQRNFFSWEGDLVANSAEPVRMLTGFMMAPAVTITMPRVTPAISVAAVTAPIAAAISGSVIANAVSAAAVPSAAPAAAPAPAAPAATVTGAAPVATVTGAAPVATTGDVSAASATRGAIGGTVIPPVLQEAWFVNNTFVGLSAAALIYANNGNDTGKLTIENNSVTGCYAGFWIFGQSRVGVLDLTLASQPEPISLIGSTIADAYPLPAYFTPSGPITVSSVTLLTGYSAPASLKGLLLGLYDLRTVMSAIEASAFTAKAGASLSLTMSNNEIDAIGATADGTVVSGGAVFIATNTLGDVKSTDFGSTIAISANKASNKAATLPTAAIFASTETALTATGNLIFNQGTATPGGAPLTSLYVSGSGGTFAPSMAPPVAAITGNVFKAPASLPPRSLAAPLNTWDVFNTQV
jgi:hypothetical protein